MSEQILTLLPSPAAAGMQKASPGQEVARAGGEFAEAVMAPAVAALERLALRSEVAPANMSGGTPLPVAGNPVPLPAPPESVAALDPETVLTALERPADAGPEAIGTETAVPPLGLPIDAPVALATRPRPVTDAPPATVRLAVASTAAAAALEPTTAEPAPGRDASGEITLGTSAAEGSDASAPVASPTGRETPATVRSGPEFTMGGMATTVRSVRPRIAREEVAARIEAAFGLRAESTPSADSGAFGVEGPGLILPSSETLDVRPPAVAVPASPLRLDGAKWQEQFVQRLTLAMNDGLREARIIVDPPELGPLDMKIGMSGGETQVQFTAYQASTRELLEEAMPRLREMFDAAGLKLTDADVRQGGQDADDAHRFQRGAGPGAAGAEPDRDPTAAPRPPRQVSYALLDVYA